ncbi:hypothetical protein [Paenibacillus herberti]|uniref:Uncharacterized protein n=1 Tax=Paenibacillus herberti TaxID=1619309 RepID=A0A229NT59_9BACL|nr:hypothetical protein [Paenibacillus herberti]OXM13002.1 hypothetical protein CGZ75_22725 [Paenibacillus herberti]
MDKKEIEFDRIGSELRLFADEEIVEAARRALKPSHDREQDGGRRLAALLRSGLGAEETALPGEGICITGSSAAALALLQRALERSGGRAVTAGLHEGIAWQQAGEGKQTADLDEYEKVRIVASGATEQKGLAVWPVLLQADSAWSYGAQPSVGAAGTKSAADTASDGLRRDGRGNYARIGSLASGAPELTAAWVSGPPELLRRVQEERQATGAISGWELRVLEELLLQGGLQQRRAAAAEACEAALQELEEALAASMPEGLRWRRDSRCAAVELLLPEGLAARALQRAARQRGLRIGVAVAAIAGSGNGRRREAARLAAGAASGAELAQALRGLAAALREFTARS